MTPDTAGMPLNPSMTLSIWARSMFQLETHRKLIGLGAEVSSQLAEPSIGF
jgi:hypothetical protein